MTADGPSGESRHILVVDDVEANRVLTRSMLERMGHRVSTADDGVQALDRLAATRFDAVLMDWHMPELDGLAASREYFRRCAEFGLEPAPVIMITAHVSDDARRQCAEAGLVGFLAKPISVESLQDCLRPWLHPDDVAAPPADAPQADPNTGVVARSATPAADDRAPTPNEPSDLLDGVTIDQLVEDLGGPETVVAIIDAFLGEADERRAAIHPATRVSTTEAHRACHTLKSTAAILGASALSRNAKEYERRLREGDVPADAELETFDQLVEATIGELTTRRNGLANNG